MARLRRNNQIGWRTALAALTPWSLLGRLRKRKTEEMRSERLRTLQDATLETIRAREEEFRAADNLSREALYERGKRRLSS